jgi:2C-methyl-D-erythritol 2,4-cyclodiphosphate synthase
MAVEIKELVIKAIIGTRDDADAKSLAPSGRPAWGEAEKQELIQACVEQALKILKKEKNR